MEIEEDEEKSSDEHEDCATDVLVLPTYINGYRRSLYRRPTNLKLEGDLCAVTENADNFIEYILTGRPDLARNPTTLKLEGDMETKTEMKEKYIPYELYCKRPLIRKSTNLHLEGLLEVSTENKEQFLPFILPPQRPRLVKKKTNLHLEGDPDWKTLYKDDFGEYKEIERCKPKLPVHNFNVEGGEGELVAPSDNYRTQQNHPVIPFLREDPRKYDGLEKTTQHLKKSKLALDAKDDGEIVLKGQIQPSMSSERKSETANKRELHNPIKSPTSPVYKNAYVNFYRDAYGKFNVERNDKKPDNQRRKTNIHFTAEAEIETSPKQNVDFRRKRPIIKKSEGHFKSEGELSNITEKRAQYIKHPVNPKPLALNTHTELKLEGPFECQPEYRRAYNDYITREQVEQQTRPVKAGAKTPRAFKAEKLVDDTEQAATLPKSKLPRPVASQHKARKQRRNSLSPSTKVCNKENVEENMFGSRINSRNRSRTVGPSVSRHTKRRKSKKRYGSPLLVENLAYAPSTSPVEAILRVAARGNFEYNEIDDTPFVVIDRPCCCHGDCGSPRELCREQKWVPLWYARPMK